MPITSKDIRFYLSASNARQGWSSASTPGQSLGGYVSTTELNVSVPLNNLFGDVTGEQNEAGLTDYRCVFIRNGHSLLTLRDAKVWIEPFSYAVAMVMVGIDSIGAVKQDIIARQAAVIQLPTNAPVGVVFYRPTSKATALSLGNLISGSVCAVWVQRSIRNAEPVDEDGFVFRVVGETRR
jgi:hypothetical protein